jgi:hypothetical protein
MELQDTEGFYTPLKKEHRSKSGGVKPTKLKVTPDSDKVEAKKTPVKVRDSSESEVSSSESDGDSSSESDNEIGNLKSALESLAGQMSTLTTTVGKLVSRDLEKGKSLPEEIRPAKKSKKLSVLKELVETLDVSKKTGGPTTASLAKNKELAVLLSAYNAGEKDFLDSVGATASLESTVASGGEKKKTLYIHDFVTRPDCIFEEEEDTLVTTGGVKLSFKSKPKRVEPHNVTPGQWISANSRIYDLLSPTLSVVQRAAYQEYTRQVGDLLQVYSQQSVMCMDHEHRRHVSATGRSWDEVSGHIERLYLRVKGYVSIPGPSTSTVQNDQTATKKAKRSSKPCFAFNSRAGCKHGDACHYKHKCSERGCGEAHPKHEHKLFRSQLPKTNG